MRSFFILARGVGFFFVINHQLCKAKLFKKCNSYAAVLQRGMSAGFIFLRIFWANAALSVLFDNNFDNARSSILMALKIQTHFLIYINFFFQNQIFFPKVFLKFHGQSRELQLVGNTNLKEFLRECEKRKLAVNSLSNCKKNCTSI